MAGLHLNALALVVFDLDGTLVDSLRDLAESVNELIVECGGAPHSQDAVGRMVGEGAATLVARAFAAAGVPAPPDALARFLAIYDRRPLRWTRPYDGVVELLDTLASRVTLALLTNKPLGATRDILEGLSLAPFFGPRVLGGDGPIPRKPDPAGLFQLMTAAGAAPRTSLMVGDSLVDALTARSAGAHACLARYGFGFASIPPDALAPEDRLIDRPLDLLTLL